MSELPLASVERIMRKAGAERVSMSAIATMAEILEDYGIKISKEAIELAKHAKRKTVKKEDVKLATRRWQQKETSSIECKERKISIPQGNLDNASLELLKQVEREIGEKIVK